MSTNKYYLILLWIFIGVIGRLVPHLSNVTPLTSLCLLSGTIFSRRFSLLLMLFILMLSDISLGWFYDYPVWGSWSFFTYSGVALITLLGTLFAFDKQLKNAIFMLIISSLFFWIWTNFGVWLFSGMYSKNPSGLFTCYLMAIPFLKNTLIGAILWGIILLKSINLSSIFSYKLTQQPIDY